MVYVNQYYFIIILTRDQVRPSLLGRDVFRPKLQPSQYYVIFY